MSKSSKGVSTTVMEWDREIGNDRLNVVGRAERRWIIEGQTKGAVQWSLLLEYNGNAREVSPLMSWKVAEAMLSASDIFQETRSGYCSRIADGEIRVTPMVGV